MRNHTRKVGECCPKISEDPLQGCWSVDKLAFSADTHVSSIAVADLISTSKDDLIAKHARTITVPILIQGLLQMEFCEPDDVAHKLLVITCSMVPEMQ